MVRALSGGNRCRAARAAHAVRASWDSKTGANGGNPVNFKAPQVPGKGVEMFEVPDNDKNEHNMSVQGNKNVNLMRTVRVEKMGFCRIFRLTGFAGRA